MRNLAGSAKCAAGAELNMRRLKLPCIPDFPANPAISKEPHISVYKIDEIEKVQRQLQQELNRMPLAEEIAVRAGSDVTVSDVREAQKYISQK